MTSVDDDVVWVENRSTTGWGGLGLGELFERRELIGFLALRDLKVRYKQAVLGVAWAVLQPLLGMVVLTIVFGRLARLPADGLPYPVFAYLGYAVWSYVSGSTNVAVHSLVNNAGIVTKVYFPRLAVPLAATLPGLVDLLFAAVLLIPLMIFYGVTPGMTLLAAPIALAIVFATVLGLGLLLASAHVRYRDVGQLLGVFTQLWFLMSPIAYAVTLVPERWRFVYALNPLSGALQMLRWAVLGGTAPGWSVAVSAASAAALLAAGSRYFARNARHFADII